jgi:hypothetical protein
VLCGGNHGIVRGVIKGNHGIEGVRVEEIRGVEEV